MLAREVYLPIGFDHAASLSFATEDLLNHELQHAALDVTGLRLEAATGPSRELGRHNCPTCLDEERCAMRRLRAPAKREPMRPKGPTKPIATGSPQPGSKHG